MIVDYFVNFCDSGYCFNEIHRCTYPQIKEAPLENIWETKIDGEIEKIKVEIDVRDKFHISYPEGTMWKCIVYIGDKQLEAIEIPCTSNMETILYTYSNIDPELKNLINDKNTIVRCEVYAGNDIVCPYSLSLIVYTKE